MISELCFVRAIKSIMTTKKSLFQLLYLVILYLFSECMTLDATRIISNTSYLSVGCVETERTALLKFKGSLKDPLGRLSSWVDEDCCEWEGVGCDNRTGNVVKLDLKCPYDWTMERESEAAAKNLSRLGGELNPSLIDLKFLNYLDLSLNNFEGVVIPEFMGSFKHLSYLNLSFASFCGMVPPHLGNLSNLHYLNLHSSYYYPDEVSWVSDLNWLSGLSSLKYLNLGYVNLSLAKSDWLQPINMLPSLLELHLPVCELQYLPQTLSFVNLTSLLVLNLRLNKFNSLIPQWVLNTSSLTDIDLSNSKLIGPIPEVAWGDLCNLQRVSLRDNNIEGETIKFLDSLSRCSKNSSLEELDLSSNQLSGNLADSLGDLQNLKSLQLSKNSFSGSIPASLGKLSSLQIFYLSSNEMNGTIPTSIGKLMSLEELDLSDNSFSCSIPTSIGKLTSLEELDLSHNSFSGSIPASIGELSSLEELDLSYNSFSGSIPASIGKLSSVERLDLSSNKMNGTIPESVGQLTNLLYFNLLDNSWEGVISEIHFLKLKNLSDFFISSSNSSFTFQVRDDWIPSFSLFDITFINCRVGPKFPAWLQTQKHLSFITLQNAAISVTIPDWLWTLTTNGLEYLDISGNQLRGKLPNTVNFASGASVNLNSNYLEGPLPLWPNLSTLSLRNNLFSGQIFEIGPYMQALSLLDLSGNNLTGSIPTSISKLIILEYLDLSNNHLSGNIPRQWEEMDELQIIDLSKNNLSGDIPSSICSLPLLIWLELNSNNLSGELSPSLRNCTTLIALDLGENKFFGNLPKWMGERLGFLEELRLRGNMFSGIIPKQLCNISNLHVLDLAQNNLSGSIPPCLGNMIGFQQFQMYDVWLPISIYTQMELDMKGRKLVYNRTLPLVNLIDLSNNNLSGDVPREITNLSTLGTLNLGRNQLTGKIPEEIGALQRLETLDLSSNHLSGPIPPSMTSITSLSYLNLSYNNLSGQIPSANQFHTWIDPSIYEGNLLCGPPLPTPCSTSPNVNNTEDRDDKDDDEDEDEDRSYKFGLFVSLALGFIMGFWLVCGSLVIKKSWRDAYFRFLNEMKDRVYVFVVVNVARLRRKMQF